MFKEFMESKEMPKILDIYSSQRIEIVGSGTEK